MPKKAIARSAEFSGKHIEAAIAKGLERLGIARQQVDIEVVKTGSRGVLGIGAEDAVVRLSFTEYVEEPETMAASEPAPSEATVSEGESPMAQVESPVAAVESPDVDEEMSEIDRVAAIGQEVLTTLVDLMGVKARVEVAEESLIDADEDAITLNVNGDDLGVLIGRRGETLRDLQFITRLIVSRRIQRWPSIIVDVEYYKARREKLLRDLAQRMAERVRLNQKSIALEPMPAHERRIVHLALRDFAGVYTESSGEGQRRKVVIYPKP